MHVSQIVNAGTPALSGDPDAILQTEDSFKQQAVQY